MKIKWGVCFCSVFLGSCAVLHRTQIGEIDQRPGIELTPFEIKVSETGVDLKEVTAIQRGLFKDSREAKAAGDLAAIISLFQMGPKTGNPVYSDSYARDLVKALHNQCPRGSVTGVTSVRETRKYPVVSGEIVKIRGYCISKKQGRKGGRSTQENGEEIDEAYASY